MEIVVCIVYFLALAITFSFLVYDNWNKTPHKSKRHEQLRDVMAEAHILLVLTGSGVFYLYAAQQYPDYSGYVGMLSLVSVFVGLVFTYCYLKHICQSAIVIGMSVFIAILMVGVSCHRNCAGPFTICMSSK